MLEARAAEGLQVVTAAVSAFCLFLATLPSTALAAAALPAAALGVLLA